MRIRVRLAAIAAGVALAGLAAPLAAADPTPSIAPATTTDGDGTGGSLIVKDFNGDDMDLTDITNVSQEDIAQLLVQGLITDEQADTAAKARLKQCLAATEAGTLTDAQAANCKALEDSIDLSGSTPEFYSHDCTINGQPAVVENGRIEGTVNDDTIRCKDLTGVDSIDGQVGDDTIIIVGDVKQRTIRGGDGNDTITVNGEVSGTYEDKGQVLGGDDHDTISVRKADKNGLVSGEAGNDSLRVDTVGYGVLEGGDGNDHLRVGTTLGTIQGGAGDDRIEGLENENSGRMKTLDRSYTAGGDGIDTCRYQSSGETGGTVDCENIEN